ncbi:MAG: Lrp/AsnC ligand binding domain-containing protein, partial [bacterium]|nr:Lrp/AsnC ligand binding domain-containing protein [bacterium]
AIKASGPVAPIIETMVGAAETTLVARTLGRFDITAEVWFDDYDHLAELLDRLRALPDTGTIDTIPYLRIAKEEFGPPQRL